MDDGYQRQLPGPAGREEGEDVKGGHGAQLVTEQHHTVFQFTAIFICHRKQFPAESLDHKARHEILAGVFFGEDEENGRLFTGERFGVDGAVEAEDLLQLRIQKGIEPGEDGGHDGHHGLIRTVQSRSSKPPGLMGVRQFVHQNLETVFSLCGSAGRQEVLHQLKHADDVPPLCPCILVRGQILRQQQDHSGEQALGRVIEKGVLTVLGCIPIRVDDGLGEDLGVLLCLGTGRQILLILTTDVHIVVDERQQIVSVRSCGVPQVNDRHLIAVVLRGDGPVIPCQISFSIQSQKTHPAGAGIFQIGIQEEGSLTDTGCADHQAVDVIGIHQRLNGGAFRVLLSLLEDFGPY